jgi:hypothetical protein
MRADEAALLDARATISALQASLSRAGELYREQQAQLERANAAMAVALRRAAAAEEAAAQIRQEWDRMRAARDAQCRPQRARTGPDVGR